MGFVKKKSNSRSKTDGGIVTTSVNNAKFVPTVQNI